jgi:hypothetical protein
LGLESRQGVQLNQIEPNRQQILRLILWQKTIKANLELEMVRVN